MPAGALLERDPDTDGRNRRRLHSFDRAVDAVLDLIGEGNPAPTAQQIAARSGISIRTVFRLTSDVDSLHAAAVSRQVERLTPLYIALQSDGPLATRIDVLVENRASIFETIAPVRRVAERLAASSTSIADGLARSHQRLRAQIGQVFAIELQRLPSRRRRDVLNAADVASSWEAWDQLRRRMGLSRPESARATHELLSGILQQLETH